MTDNEARAVLAEAAAVIREDMERDGISTRPAIEPFAWNGEVVSTCGRSLRASAPGWSRATGAPV